MKQLDLFCQETVLSGSVDAPPSGAVIVPFPQQRNIGRARHVAQKLRQRDGKSKESYWRRSCADLAAVLSKSGLGSRDVEQQLLSFRDAVGVELGRMPCKQADLKRPGGAS